MFTVIGFLFKQGRIRPLSHLQPNDYKKKYFCLFLSGWDGRTDGRTKVVKSCHIPVKEKKNSLETVATFSSPILIFFPEEGAAVLRDFCACLFYLSREFLALISALNLASEHVARMPLISHGTGWLCVLDRRLTQFVSHHNVEVLLRRRA